MVVDKPRRTLAVLYWIWAAFQAVGAIREAGRGPGGLSQPGLYWLVMVLLVIAYAVDGALLWRMVPRGRALGIVLAVVALVAFPLGTLLGVFALWELLRRKPQPVVVEEPRPPPPPPSRSETYVPRERIPEPPEEHRHH